MHHPGQPRFAAVGETIELAPRDPDPDGTYSWSVVDAPDESSVSLGNEPVLWFTPDVPGVYTLGLDAPDETHELTVRVFPGELAVTGTGSGQSGYSGYSGVSGVSGVSGQRSGGFSGSVRGSGTGTEGQQRGRPRIQLSGDVDGDDVIVRATAKTSPNSDADDDSLDVEFVVDDRDPEPPGLTIDDREARIPIADVEAPVRLHAVAIGDQYSVPDAVRVHPDGTVELLNDPPQWGKEMSLYEVYVRGYKDGDNGDTVLEVIEDNLDEIQDNGVDTLWLTPVLQNDGFDHGYNITDFFSIADDIGTEEQFEELVESAHDRGMKVLFDLVLNHSARDHEFFQKAQAGDPEYRDWYEWQEDGSPGTYFDWEYIANFNFENLEVRRHLLDAVDKWAEYVDGFRCDMAWAVPTPFWQEIRERVREDHPEFVLLDETIPYIADFHNLAFDIHFDTTLYFTLRQIGRGEADGDEMLSALEQRAVTGFPDHAGFMLYIENHDETRYVEECGREALEAAAAAQFTLPGVPMLYAGQEIGERNRRGKIYWAHAQEDLREYYQDLTYTRNTIPALQYEGDYEEINYQCDADQVTAFAREDNDGNRYVVALNFGGNPATVSFPEEDVEAFDEVSDEDVTAADGDATVENVVVLYAGSA